MSEEGESEEVQQEGTHVSGDGRRKASDAQVIECLNETFGIVQQAARLLHKKYGVRYSRSGLKRRIDNSPKLTAARNEAEAGGLEFAEAGLFSAIKNGKVPAIIFYLQSRSEKYRPRVDVGPVRPPRDEAAVIADLRKLGFVESDEQNLPQTNEAAEPDPETPDA